jgi:transposase
VAEGEADKLSRLRESRTLHPHPERVTDPLFQEGRFFDARDLLQVRYEMVRRNQAEHQGIARTARDFGVSRPTVYQAQRRFRQGGISALVNLRSGPKGSRKVRGEVLTFVEEIRSKEGRVPYRKLARRVQERFGATIHPTTLLRALNARGKKPRRKAPARRTARRKRR